MKYNRVTVFQDKRYEYDVHGRVETKRIGRHTEQQFSYDGEHRLREVQTVRDGVRQTVVFEYDALGRRIRKRDAAWETLFLWNELRMVQEQRGKDVATYVYEQSGYVPLARINHGVAIQVATPSRNDHYFDSSRSEILHFQNDCAGIPDQLQANDGEIVWTSTLTSWGATVNETCLFNQAYEIRHESQILQNLRLQGQYLDRETGLHFNTLRFYDPDIGRFISNDPIGLKGGDNLQLYAVSPTGWIDPLGLSGERFPVWMNTRQGYQRQHLIPYSLRNHPLFVSSGMDINSASNMMYLPVARGIDPRTEMGLHRGWTQQHLNYNKGIRDAMDAMRIHAVDEGWDYRQIQQKIIDLQRDRRHGFIKGRYSCA